jgi:hypothetical protein
MPTPYRIPIPQDIPVTPFVVELVNKLNAGLESGDLDLEDASEIIKYAKKMFEEKLLKWN